MRSLKRFMKKIISFIFVFSFFILSIFGETYSTMRPNSRTLLEDSKDSSITIKCNVSGAEIYINNRYQGRSDLVINSLTPGYYNLEVRKSGYESKYYRIQVVRGYSYTYEVNLEKVYGYISIINFPSNGQLYIDGTRFYETYVKVDVGYHEIRIKKFGYKEAGCEIYVDRHDTSYVDGTLEEEDFYIADFKSSRSSINPDYTNGLSKCSFSFYVSNNGTAQIYIEDENGNICWSYSFNSFSTWENAVLWYGQDSSGNYLPDGLYTAVLVSGNMQDAIYIRIDRDLTMPLIGISHSGGSIGSIPMAYHSECDFFVPYISYELNLNYTENKNLLSPSPVSLGFLWGFDNAFEFGISLKCFSFSDNIVMPLGANFLLRGNLGLEVSDYNYWNTAFILRYGFSSVVPFEPFGVDTGNGLGLGLATGFDSPYFYFGGSMEIILGAGNGNIELDNSVIKSGLALEYKPSGFFNIGLWAALHSAFGLYKDSYTALDENYLYRSVEIGLETKLFSGYNGLMFKAGINGKYFLDSGLYFSTNLCLSYFL